MDAVEFLKQYSRMVTFGVQLFKVPSNLPYEEIVSRVEQWAKEHPIKTRQSEFLKMFPNASVGYNGTLVICPSQADTKAVAGCVRSERNCDKCKRDFWLKEVNDNKED